MQRYEKKKKRQQQQQTKKSKMIGISLNAVHRHDRKG